MDDLICYHLGLDENQYKHLLIKKFKAIDAQPKIYFLNREQAKKAYNWIISKLMLDKLKHRK